MSSLSIEPVGAKPLMPKMSGKQVRSTMDSSYKSQRMYLLGCVQRACETDGSDKLEALLISRYGVPYVWIDYYGTVEVSVTFWRTP